MAENSAENGAGNGSDEDRRDRVRFNITDATVQFRKSAGGKPKRFTVPLLNISRGGMVFAAPVSFEAEERVVLTVNLPKKTNYLKLVCRCRWCEPVEGRDAYRVGVSFDRYGSSVEQRLASLEVRFGFLETADADAPESGPAVDAEEAKDLPVDTERIEAEDISSSEIESVPQEFAEVLDRFKGFVMDDQTIEDILSVLETGVDFDDLAKEEETEDRSEVLRTLVPVYELGEALPAAFDTNGAPTGEPLAYIFLPNMPNRPSFSLRVNREEIIDDGPPRFENGDLLFFSNRKVEDGDHALVVMDGQAFFGQAFLSEDGRARLRPPHPEYRERTFPVEEVTALWRMVAKVDHF